MAKIGVRDAGRIAAFLAVAVISSCSTKVWDAIHKPFPALPHLLDDLPSSFEAGAHAKFTARLAARFPVGTPELQVMRALWLDGFQPVTGPQADPRSVSFTSNGDIFHEICERYSSIHWSTDSEGRLIAISGRYFMTCS
jgi:hypothetical protein